MYAVTIKINEDNLFDSGIINANGEIENFMLKNGFTCPIKGFYLGESTINVVNCVLVIQGIAKQFHWFTSSVQEMRMFRIEESCDLFPAI